MTIRFIFYHDAFHADSKTVVALRRGNLAPAQDVKHG